jgi:TrmH family RNA methyltransferase
MRRLRIQRENATYQLLNAIKTNRQKRAKRGEIFVEGVAPINAAADAGLSALQVVHAETTRLSGWAHETIERLQPETLITLSQDLMARVSDRTDPSELVVVFERPKPDLAHIEANPSSCIAIFDRPSNTGNLGSAVRSCNAFGIAGVVTTGHGVDIYDPQLIRASLGAVFSTTVVHEPSTRELIQWLEHLRARLDGMEVIGTDSEGEASLREAELNRPVVLIFGNEATGLSVALRSAVDRVLAIPIEGTVNSLNLACAASVFLYSVKPNARQ